MLDVAGSTDDIGMLRVLEAVARAFDRHTHRHFFTSKETRFFEGNGKNRVLLDWDLARITSLKEDDNHDATYNITFSSSDFLTWPYEAKSTQDRDDARPITALEINLRSSGVQDIFMKGQRRYQLIGFFGYTERIRDTGARVAGGSSELTTSSTKFTASSSQSALYDGLSAGQTLLLDSEQMYVTQKDTSIFTVHVIRAVNGTTEAAHSSSTVVNRFVYPAPIVEANIMQASRLWARREKGFADNAVGLVESGQAGPMVTGMDRDVREEIQPYVKRLV